MKNKTIKLLGDNIEYIHELGIEKGFLVTIMSINYEGKNDKSVYIVYKNFCSSKNTMKRAERQDVDNYNTYNSQRVHKLTV